MSRFTVGVWDCFSPTEAVESCMDVIENGGTATSAAESLCSEAVDRAVHGPGETVDGSIVHVQSTSLAGNGDS